MSKLAQTLANNLETQRLKIDITRAELANRAGVAQPKMSKYLKGTQKPNLDTIERLAEGLGCQPFQLLIDDPVAAIGALLTENPECVDFSANLLQLTKELEKAYKARAKDAQEKLELVESVQTVMAQAHKDLKEAQAILKYAPLIRAFEAAPAGLRDLIKHQLLIGDRRLTTEELLLAAEAAVREIAPAPSQPLKRTKS